MICPHCGMVIDQKQSGLYSVANGANPPTLNLVFNTVACANPFPAHAINVRNVTLNAAAASCNPIPQVTYIKL